MNLTLATPQDPTQLFKEFLQAHDAGRPVDVAALCARAGDRSAEIERRVRVFQALHELSEVLRPATDRAPEQTVGLKQLGRYRDLVQIGQGGLSQVLLGYDTELDRRVALKVLSPLSVATDKARAWIQNEGRTIARLAHESIVRVFEIGEADGHAYVAMEYLSGPSLAQVIGCMSSVAGASPAVEVSTEPDEADRSGAADASGAGGANGLENERAREAQRCAADLSTVAARCHLVLLLARALEYCHERGVVHRDIKPGNILLQPGPAPKLIDFGLAHLESEEESLTKVTQNLAGTPAYMAPEQIDNLRTGASSESDQFSLGVVFYELLTLVNPFEQPSRAATQTAISRAEPPPPRAIEPAIPLDLERIVLHALERDPRLRYRSMHALADDIQAFLEHRAISLLPPTPMKVARLWVRRHWARLALVSTGLFLALALAAGGWIVGGARERAALRADRARISADTSQLTSTSAFTLRYIELDHLRQSSRSMDHELVSGLVGRGLEAGVQSEIEALSRRLHAVLEAEWGPLDASPGKRSGPMAHAILAQWGPVLDLDKAVCPECLLNVRDRDRGTIELPALGEGSTLELWSYQPDAKSQDMVLVKMSCTDHLAPGFYRCRRHDAVTGVWSETEFCLHLEDDRRRLALRSPSPELARTMVLIPAGEHDPFKAEKARFRTSSFWISPHLVTWREAEAVLGQRVEASRRFLELSSQGQGRDARSVERAGLSDDSPAILRWKDALEYANAVGARLPSQAEWLAAWKSQQLQFDETGDLRGELLSSLTPSADARLTIHFTNTQHPHASLPTFDQCSDEGIAPGTGFRLVLSELRPEKSER